VPYGGLSREWCRPYTKTAKNHLGFYTEIPLFCAIPEAHPEWDISTKGRPGRNLSSSGLIQCLSPNLALFFQKEIFNFREEFQLNLNLLTVYPTQ
jgi:hypothetical protein